MKFKRTLIIFILLLVSAVFVFGTVACKKNNDGQNNNGGDNNDDDDDDDDDNGAGDGTIDLDLIGQKELSESIAEVFGTSEGGFSLVAGKYNAQQKAIELNNLGYAYKKMTLPSASNRYQLTSHGSPEHNSGVYLRFKAGGTGGVQPVLVAGSFREDLETVMLTEDARYYQIQLPDFYSQTETSVVLFNPAPADLGALKAYVYEFDIVKEPDPSNRYAYYKDMFKYSPALDVADTMFTFSPAGGWNGFKGISRGDKGNVYKSYLDTYGVAFEYGDLNAANKSFEGVGMWAKVKIPADCKKITYWGGYINQPDAYRIEIFDGEFFQAITASNPNINTDRIAADEGWSLLRNRYDEPNNEYEVAIPSDYQGDEVIIIFSAKYNRADTYGCRFNNIYFSSDAVAEIPQIIDGIDIGGLAGMTATQSDAFNFTDSLEGFEGLFGVTHASGMAVFGGTASAPNGSPANAAAAIKLTAPSADYLRLTVAAEAGKSVNLRVWFVEFAENRQYELLPLTKVTGGDFYVIQITAFPHTFKGDVGLVIESAYIGGVACSLQIDKIEFTQTVRDASGYDTEALLYLPVIDMPEDGKMLFTPDELAKWTIFTGNTHTNTKGLQNGTEWLQLQSELTEGEFSTLAAYKTVFDGSYSTLTLITGNIHKNDLGSVSMARVRAYDTATGQFYNFTDSITDSEGWFNANTGDMVRDLSWGRFFTNTLSVPSGIEGREVILLIEFSYESSTMWNVLFQSLSFA